MARAPMRGEAYASPAPQEAGTTFSGLARWKGPSWQVRPACTGTRKGLRVLQQIPCRGRAGKIAVLSAIIAEGRIARWTAQMIFSSSNCHVFVQAGSLTWAWNLSPSHELLPPASLCKHGSLRLTLPLRRATPP